MKLCRFNNDRLGVVEGETIKDVSAALDVLPSLRWPLPQGDQFIRSVHDVDASLPDLFIDFRQSVQLGDRQLRRGAEAGDGGRGRDASSKDMQSKVSPGELKLIHVMGDRIARRIAHILDPRDLILAEDALVSGVRRTGVEIQLP